MILVVGNSLTVPLSQTYFIEYTFGLVVDQLFIVDIIMGFLTSFIDKYGRECFECKQIALNYVRTTQFKIDLVTLLGSY